LGGGVGGGGWKGRQKLKKVFEIAGLVRPTRKHMPPNIAERRRFLRSIQDCVQIWVPLI